MRRRLVPIAIFGLFAACGEAPTEPAPSSWRWEHPYPGARCDLTRPGVSLAPARVDSTSFVPQRETIDDRMAAASRAAPGGFAGRWSEDGVVVISMVHPEFLDDAIPVLREHGIGVGIRPPVRSARWDFAQLYDWYRYLSVRGLWSTGGVYSSTIDERANRLEYGVLRKDLGAFRSFLEAHEVPCGLVVADVIQADRTPFTMGR